MKALARSMMLAAAVVLAALPAAAGEEKATKPQVSKEDIQKQVTEIKARLNLSEEQEQQIKPLVQEEMQKLKAIKAKYGDDTTRRNKRKMFREAKSVQEDFEGKLSKVLNKDQMKIWKDMQKERREKVKAEMERRKSEAGD
jgi:hypothetical protein